MYVNTEYINILYTCIITLIHLVNYFIFVNLGKIFPKEEDEEGEMFNHSCLADLKHGKVRLNDHFDKQYNERLSELQARNSLCPPHLRSCYAAETNYLPNASLITEEDIKVIFFYFIYTLNQNCLIYLIFFF